MTNEIFLPKIPWNKGMKGIYHLSEEHRRRISEAGRGRHHSEETKRKISEAYHDKGNPMFGKHHSQETKRKMSESHRGKNKGEKHYSFGKHLSEEHRYRISEALQGERCYWFGKTGKESFWFGKHHSEESRLKMTLKAKCGKENPMYGAIPKSAFQQGHIPWNKGKPFMAKEKHPLWNGGTSFIPYPFLFDSQLKKIILERDNCRCQNPNCVGRFTRLDIHHIDYDKENCAYNNLITTCISCNAKANFGRKRWQAFYGPIASKNSTQHFNRTAGVS